MKLILPLVLATAALLHAEETNLPPFTLATMETLITSKSVEFDLKSRTAVYREDVHVADPRVNLTCDKLTANIPADGRRVDSIVAESNVIILIPENGATNRATAAKAVYVYKINAGVTNEMLELTGSPTIETPQGTLTGDSILWDRANNTIKATNQRMIVRPDAAASTNSVATNAPVAAPATP
jgi:lipopolysaccharide transport protein LptA